MDDHTPERNNNNTPQTTEGSPFSNYINGLSPLKPVKPAYVTQTFGPLSFSSPPVFTSPQVSCHKESRFLRRHNLLDISSPKVSSEDVNKIYSSEEAPAHSTHACHDSNEQQENTDQRISVGDSSIVPSSEYTRFSSKLRGALNYNSGGHGYNPLLYGDVANSRFELPGKPAPYAACVQEAPKKDSVEGDMHLRGVHHIGERDNLITDASNVLILGSPNVTEAFRGLMNQQLDPSVDLSKFFTRLPQSTTYNCGRMQPVNLVASGSEPEIQYHPNGPITGQTQNNLPSVALMTSNPSEKMNDELLYATYRGMSMRRSLDYEMAGVQRKNSGGSSHISSSTVKSDERGIGNEKLLLHTKHTCDSNLNPLATLKDYKSAESEPMSSQMQPNFPSSTSSMLLSSRQECHQSMVPASMENDLEPSEDEVQHAEDFTQSPEYMADEDFHQNVPKKKRRKLEPAGEGSCKRCNCKKSKCLKLYCECFAAGVYCREPCMCRNCLNKPIHEETVLQARKQIESRNPLAFAPKVIRSSDSTPETTDDPNKTPASVRHKRGCNCKKSSCLKKYCECYQGGVGCSISCRCEACKNAYGRKDGSAPSEIEAEHEEETIEREKSAVGKASRKTKIQNTEDQSDCALPTTPLQPSRRLPLPSSSEDGNPSRSFIATISASGLIASEKLGKSNALQSQVQLEKPFQTAPNDDSSSTCIKISSPNGKRISSPKCERGLPPTRRGGRKLILQSIPSFPSLAPPQ